VKGKTPKNLAASVRERLSQAAKKNGEEFQYVLTRYAMERLLYRLSRSKHAKHLILKGAMLFQYWTETSHRTTRDLDLLASGAPSVTRFEEVFREVCDVGVEDDGLEFFSSSIRGEQIKEEDEYQGIRIRGEAKLSNVRIPLQIDVGFGDAITPGPAEIEYPTLLEFPAPKLLAYNRETVIAEKFQAMVYLGIANSRMKDFFDVWSLAQTFDFDRSALSQAVHATFKRRGSTFPTELPLALTDEFAADSAKRKQWQGFVRKTTIGGKASSLEEVVSVIREFLAPILNSVASGKGMSGTWAPGGPWIDDSAKK